MAVDNADAIRETTTIRDDKNHYTNHLEFNNLPGMRILP